MKKTIYFLPIIILTLFASKAMAAVEITTFKQLINVLLIDGLLTPLVPLLIGLAILVFFYGIILTVISPGGEKKADGKKYMLWGIIGIFVMFSVWGFVNLLIQFFGLKSDIPQIKIDIPTIKQETNTIGPSGRISG